MSITADGCQADLAVVAYKPSRMQKKRKCHPESGKQDHPATLVR